VTDTVTGLIWLQQVDCLSIADWRNASHTVAGLKDGDCNLTDKSAAGDWRLPTKDEWSATIAQAFTRGCYNVTGPSLTNDWGTGCLAVGPSLFAGVALDFYWSSTTNAAAPTNAWSQYLANSGVYSQAKSTGMRVWPVRAASR
jgi:hypothetical protein